MEIIHEDLEILEGKMHSKFRLEMVKIIWLSTA
jgi:hypothetical protein